MNNNISFRHFSTAVKIKGFSFATLAQELGITPSRVSAINREISYPTTETLAKICSVLKVYPSEIVSFDDIVINEKYFTNDKRLPLPTEFTGALTYKPLWYFLDDYLNEVNKNLEEGEPKKTANDLFNKINPPLRKKIASMEQGFMKEMSKKAVVARFGEGYKSKREKRTDYSQGLPLPTRTKLRNERSLTLEVIYEICKYLGCSIDFIISYK